MNSCPSKELLKGWLKGGLPNDLATYICAHIEHCSSCQSMLAHLTDDPLVSQWIQESVPLPVAAFPHVLASASHRVRGAKDCNKTGEDGLFCLDPPLKDGDLGSIGTLRVLEEISRGGMGVVFKAYDDQLGRHLAIKVIRGTETISAERLHREAHALAQFRHPNVVSVYSDGRCRDGTPYVAMEYIPGPSLQQVLAAKKRLEPSNAANIIAQAADGLYEAHQKGLTHRDIKPSNILLESSNGSSGEINLENDLLEGSRESIKIIDFGLVHDVADKERLTREGCVPGTPEYLSPELIQSPEHADNRSDIYALGVTFYECLTGTVPFRGAPALVLRQVVEDEPKPPRLLDRHTPRDLETICLKCLHKLPRRRYQSAAALADDLRRYLRNEPIHARQVGFWERVLKWIQRRPAVAALIAVSFLAVLSLATGGWWHSLQLQSALDDARQQKEAPSLSA